MPHPDSSLKMHKNLEIFDTSLDRRQIRNILMKQAHEPWSHAPKAEARVSEMARDQVILVFRFDEDAALPAASVFLHESEKGLDVPNIVPLASGHLTISQYNSILDKFVADILVPAQAETPSLKFELSSGHEVVNDWLSEEAASALQRFSALANKSTGASHPSDQKRWFAFLVSNYRNPSNADTYRIERWLLEVEGWPAEVASDLSAQFETMTELLRFYDESGS